MSHFFGCKFLSFFGLERQLLVERKISGKGDKCPIFFGCKRPLFLSFFGLERLLLDERKNSGKGDKCKWMHFSAKKDKCFSG